MQDYPEIRKEAEEKGYEITDELYEYLLWYARRKAETSGKDESYIPYLLPDVIKEYFFRNAVNSITFAAMGFERYKKTQKQEVTENGGNHRKAVAI